jgi:DNA helicase-2/ATP-dependent DNA helicase PcrA
MVDLTSANGAPPAMQMWRGGGPLPARQGWIDAGITPRMLAEPSAPANGQLFEEGMVVKHETYGAGRVTEVSGYGVLRKVKVRFSTAGERTFLADKAKLEIVHARA